MTPLPARLEHILIIPLNDKRYAIISILQMEKNTTQKK